MPSASKERIERAKVRVAQAQARLEALSARAAAYDRKLDARRKIILGGLLISAAERDERYQAIVAALLQRLSREADRRAFEGWQLPSDG
jgi:uncharacterized protein (DUF3084 family)